MSTWQCALRTYPEKKAEAKKPSPKPAYFVAARRGPSIGKSAWKPGGTAHPVRLIERTTARGNVLRWYEDVVTGKRVQPWRHSVEVVAGRKDERVERLVRNLCFKAENGGLTAQEMDKLRLLASSPTVEKDIRLAELIRRVLIIPSDCGRTVTARNARKTSTEKGTNRFGNPAYARTTLLRK